VDDDEIHQKMTIENEKAFHRGSDLDGSMNQDQFNEFEDFIRKNEDVTDAKKTNKFSVNESRIIKKIFIY